MINEIKQLAEKLGCKANCHSCIHSSEDTDGEYGEVFCGTVCGKGISKDETYLEDANIDLNSEKDCWEPDFWKTPGNEFLDLITEDGSPEKAYKAFDEKVNRLKKEIGVQSTPKREKCFWCNKRRIPFGHQAFTGRPFCSPVCFDEYRRSEGLI